MFCLKLVSVLLLLFSSTYSAIIEKNITFIEGQGIDLSQGTTITLKNCENVNCTVDSAVYKNADFDLAYFLTMFWDDFVCGCGGGIYSLLSKDTMWYAKKTDDFNTNTPFVLSDTNQFQCLASPDNNYYLSKADYEELRNPCPSCYDEWPQLYPHWHIGKTKKSKYFMFQFTGKKVVFDSLTESSQEQTEIHYFLQDDGSLDFSGAKITSVINKNERFNGNSGNKKGLFLITSSRPSKLPSGVIYNLQGRKMNISTDALKSRIVPRVIISNQ